MAGVYMCVCLHIQEGGGDISLTRKTLSWETVLTAGFELDVLRRKRPYRWTIWVSSLRRMGLHQLNEIAVPWNPLHRLTCLHLLIHYYGRP